MCQIFAQMAHGGKNIERSDFAMASSPPAYI